MARGLTATGHQVTMVTEFPNHPAGIIPPEYRGRLIERTEVDGIDVIRVWVKASPDKTFTKRMSFYISYMFMAIAAGLFIARGKYDAVYATSPPLFVGAAGLILSFLRRLPLFIEIRDLWPESAVQMGELNGQRAIQLSTMLEESCYRRASHIVAVTKGIKERLVERGIAAEKITVIPNGANTDLYIPRPVDRDLQARLGLKPEYFVVIYTGLIGLIHGLETILETASLFADHKNIRFLIVGDGPRKMAILRMRETMPVNNILIHDAVPESELPKYIALADIGLHVQKDLAVSAMALPVKMFSYMACERPVLLAIRGEAAELLQEAKAGIVVPPEDPAALAEAILELQSDPERCREYGRNGRLTVEKLYSRKAQANHLSDLFISHLIGR